MYKEITGAIRSVVTTGAFEAGLRMSPSTSTCSVSRVPATIASAWIGKLGTANGRSNETATSRNEAAVSQSATRIPSRLRPTAAYSMQLILLIRVTTNLFQKK